MKIRNSFVSNSSSSSFVVEVHKGFVVKSDTFIGHNNALSYIDDYIAQDHDEDDGIIPNDVVIKFNDMLDKLKNGKVIYGSGGSYDLVLALAELLKDLNFVVMTLDGPGGDGEDVIVPFIDERKKC